MTRTSIDITDFLDLFATEVARINDLDDEVVVTLDSDVVNDLDIDSLGILEVVLRLQSQYRVSISEEDVHDAVTVQDFVDLVENARE